LLDIKSIDIFLYKLSQTDGGSTIENVCRSEQIHIIGVGADFLEAGKMPAIGNGFPINNVDATRLPGLEPTTSSLARNLLYHCTTHSYASISSFHSAHIIPHGV
jgi:hypothetical protein